MDRALARAALALAWPPEHLAAFSPHDGTRVLALEDAPPPPKWRRLTRRALAALDEVACAERDLYEEARAVSASYDALPGFKEAYAALGAGEDCVRRAINRTGSASSAMECYARSRKQQARQQGRRGRSAKGPAPPARGRARGPRKLAARAP